MARDILESTKLCLWRIGDSLKIKIWTVQLFKIFQEQRKGEKLLCCGILGAMVKKEFLKSFTMQLSNFI